MTIARPNISTRIITTRIRPNLSLIPFPKGLPADMLEAESGKPDNWSALLGSVAAFLGALAAWFYRKAGQVPRPEGPKLDAEILREALKPIREQLDTITSSLQDTSTKVNRVDGRLDGFSLRLARVEGHQQDAAD